jgi:hypothetical protein
VAATSGGYNNIVDPLELMKDFNSILQNRSVATQVSVTMLVHKGLAIYNDDGIEENFKVTKEVGNVTVSVEESTCASSFCFVPLTRHTFPFLTERNGCHVQLWPFENAIQRVGASSLPSAGMERS